MAQSRATKPREAQTLDNLKSQSKKAIEREVFGNDATKPNFQTGAGQGGADLDEQLKRELGAAAEKEDDNPLSAVAQAMLQVRLRMMQSDSGPATITLQKQIVTDLDRLIEQARKSCGQCSSSAPQSATQKAGSPSSKPSSKGAQRTGTKPESVDVDKKSGGQSRKPDMDEMQSLMKDLWGELPAHEREQMLQLPAEDFMPKYQELLEDYFRGLSEEKTGNKK
jgi:hypothetical protein